MRCTVFFHEDGLHYLDDRLHVWWSRHLTATMTVFISTTTVFMAVKAGIPFQISKAATNIFYYRQISGGWAFPKCKRLSLFYISLNNMFSFPAGLIYPFISKTEKTVSKYQTKILWYFDWKRKSRKQGLLFRFITSNHYLIYYIPNSFFSHTSITGSGMTTCRFSISISSFLTNALFTYGILLLLIKLL